MKFKIHVPTTDYGFIEAEYDTIEEALAEHDRIINIIKEKDGLSVSEWKRVRMTMLKTAEFDPNLLESLSKAQRFWINESKKTLRDIKREEEPETRGSAAQEY